MSRLLACLLLAILVTACSRHDAIWEQARDEDTVTAYEAYLERYPEGPRAAQARSRVRALEVEEAWGDARVRDSRSGYEAFLETWGDSDFAAEAGDRLAAIDRRDAWRSLAATDDVSALETFVERHPDAPEAELATARIELLEARQAREDAQPDPPTSTRDGEADGPQPSGQSTPDTDDQGTHRVQLAAVSSEARAREGITRLEREHGDILGGLRLVTEPANDMYRLLTEPMPRARATEVCNALQASGQDCLVRPR